MAVADVVRRSKGLEILFALSEGPKFVSDLQRSVGGSSTTVEERITELIHEGVIVEEKMGTAPFRRTLTLTEKGREVTDNLRRTNNLLSGQLPEKRYATLVGILTVLGEVRSRTKLEKLVFLLQNEFGYVTAQPYAFSANKHGPYSKEMINDTEELQRLSIIEEETTTYEPYAPDGREVVQYTYRITPFAQGLSKIVYENLSADQRSKMAKLKKYNDMPLKQLLAYVHDKWPHLKN